MTTVTTMTTQTKTLLAALAVVAVITGGVFIYGAQDADNTVQPVQSASAPAIDGTQPEIADSVDPSELQNIAPAAGTEEQGIQPGDVVDLVPAPEGSNAAPASITPADVSGQPQ